MCAGPAASKTLWTVLDLNYPPHTSMESLPNELQIHIGNMLNRRRRDLCAFALVSTHFKGIVLPLLYRCLTLSPKPHLISTLLLLDSSSLAKSVQELTICNLPSQFDYSFISKMTCLRSLSMISCGVIFDSSVDQDSFVEILIQSCLNLQYLHIELDNILPGPGFSVPKLQKIYWKSPDGFDSPLLSLCQGSASTLTHISFPEFIDPTNLLLAFTQIDFPNLVLMNVGPCDLEGMDAVTSSSMVEFFMRHPGIEHLHLGYHLDGNTDNVLHLDQFLTDPNILPNLKTLGARPYTIATFLKICANFWDTLSSLNISHGLDGKAGLQAVVRQLDISKNVHKIRHLELYIQSEAHVYDQKFFLGRMNSLSPLLWRLESIRCDIPSDLTYDNFTQAFRRFKHIRVLDFLGWPTEPFSGPHKGEMAWDLAAVCKKLEVVRFRTVKSKVEEEITIDRDPDGVVMIGEWLSRTDLNQD